MLLLTLRAWRIAPAGVFLTATTLAYLNLIPGTWFRSPWDKVMHFLIYGGLAFSAYPFVWKRWRSAAWWMPLTLAWADELAQSWSPVRSADTLDLAADTAGILLACTVARGIRPAAASRPQAGSGSLERAWPAIHDPSIPVQAARQSTPDFNGTPGR